MSIVSDLRLRKIREGMVRGDVNRIAYLAGVSRFWATRVLRGQQTSEKVLVAAEQLIASRKAGNEKG